MKRRFTVDASKKIKAAIVPYRKSTSDLINNDGLDSRFDYDLPHDFTISVNGKILPALTVYSEVILLEDYDPWAPEETELGETPTGIKFTVLLPIYPDTLDGDRYYDSVPELMGTVKLAFDTFLDSEIGGSDYCWYIADITCKEDEYNYLIPLAKDELSQYDPNSAIGYYLVELVVAPICP